MANAVLFYGSAFLSFAKVMRAANMSQLFFYDSLATAGESGESGESGSRHTASQVALAGPGQPLGGFVVENM